MLTSQFTVELATGKEPATGVQWVQVLPLGRTIGRDGRGPYSLAPEDMTAVIDATRRYAGRVQLPIDYEHAIDLAQDGTKAPAAGWITALQQRDDGLWAKVEWTPVASGHLKAREYRYISPVFHHTRNGRITRLLRASLTNTPNFDLKAVAQMETETDMDEQMVELRQLLDLPEDADLLAVVEAVRSLLQARQSSAPDPKEYVPIGDFERVVADLNKRDGQGVSLHAAETIVGQAIDDRKLPPYLKDWAIGLCSVDKEAFERFVERTKGAVGRVFKTSHASARAPSDRQPRSLDDNEAAVARALGHSAEDFHKYAGN